MMTRKIEEFVWRRMPLTYPSYNMPSYIPRPHYTYGDRFQTDCTEWFVDLWLDNIHIAKRSIWDERERKQGRRSKPFRSVEDDDLPIVYEATIPRAAITGVEVREHRVERYGTYYTMGRIYITVTEDAADPRELEPLKAVEFPIQDQGHSIPLGAKVPGVDAKGTIDTFTKLPTGDATKICVFQEIFSCNPGDYWLSHREDNALYKGFQELGNALKWCMGRDGSA
jgi:hypothetical protein